MLAVVERGRTHGMFVGIQTGVIDRVPKVRGCIGLQGNVAGRDLWQKQEGLVMEAQTELKKQGQSVLTRRNRHCSTPAFLQFVQG